MPSEKKLILKSSDGEEFEIEESVAVMSTTLKNMIELDCASNSTTVPVPNVNGKTLAMVIEYCKKHARRSHEIRTSRLSQVDSEFLDTDDQTVLSELIAATNFLHVQKLLDATLWKAVNMTERMTPEEITKWFNIVNDLICFCLC